MSARPMAIAGIQDIDVRIRARMINRITPLRCPMIKSNCRLADAGHFGVPYQIVDGSLKKCGNVD